MALNYLFSFISMNSQVCTNLSLEPRWPNYWFPHICYNSTPSCLGPVVLKVWPIRYMQQVVFIHSSVSRQLDCFHVLAIVNSAAMNIGVHVSFWIMVFSGYMPRNRIAGSYGSTIFSFFFLRNLHIVLLEKEMATHSSILAWRIPWTEEPGGLWSMRWQKSWTQLKQLSSSSILFSIVSVPISTNSVGGFPFLYALCSIYCLQNF